MNPSPAEDQSAASGSRLRDAAVKVALALQEAGHEAYFAGGCVRDRLMGHEPTDYDIATDAVPDEVAAIFPRVHTVGKSFGVMLVRLKGQEIQVATFRTEGPYSDGRHPDSVAFSDAEHDAKRRDFTINGLFEDPRNGKVIDLVGGVEDLHAKVIRAIGDPAARIREDRLRMLRAVRFAARFGFAIEADTADAIRSSATELRGVSRERVGMELKRMFSDSNRAVAAWELQYLGLDSQVLLEEHQVVAPTRLGRLPDETSYPTALAAWLLDRHHSSGADLGPVARRWAESLLLSNDEREAIDACLEVFGLFSGGWDRLGIARQKRLAASAPFTQALMLLQATDRQAFVDVRRRVIELGQSGLQPAALLDGDDLIAMGLKPGPVFSRVLDAVYDAQLEGSVTSKPQALEMAKVVAATNAIRQAQRPGQH